MNDYLLSVLLGIVEGLTEFLPVSSTAHLRITEAIFGVDLTNGYWKMYTIVIQLGAILCLPIYFRSRIARLLSTFPNGERGDRTFGDHPITLVVVAFVCTAAPAFLLTKVIGKHLESLYLISGSLIIGGIVMWLVDVAYGQPGRAPLIPLSKGNAGTGFATEKMEDMSLMQAIWIGACQTLSAVFPGTSRSMSTIAAGQLTGMSRPAALEFSFFLSIPTMAAATCYDLLKSLRHKPGEISTVGSLTMDAHSWMVLGVGFVISFVVAYGVVAWFMNWVQKHGFVPFAIYRIVVGLAVLAWAMKWV